jgi:cytochrome c biogenesis protein
MKIRYLLIKNLANLPFAIGVLLSIASASIVGSIIEQDKPTDFYQTSYSPIYSRLILEFGLDHVFHTYWFISLMLLFGTSLICCTFLQQLPILKNAQKFRFLKSPATYKRLAFNTQTIQLPSGSVVLSLKDKNYRVFQSNGVLYANKGILGRISPIVVHFSMVVILVGTIFASTSGFVAQEFIPETEVFYIQNVINNNLNNYVPQILGRVNDFWIAYSADQSIKQFYTDFSILDNNGKELKRETIYVNHPLRYNGLTFYQTDWDVLGMRVKFENSATYQIPIIKPTKNLWFSWIPNQEDNSFLSGYTISNPTIRGKTIVYDTNGKFLGESEFDEPLEAQKKIRLCDFITATGIQVKSDPGIPLIYIGFFFLIISIVTSYISYSQIWLTRGASNSLIGGRTNRSKIHFDFEILNIILKFQKSKKMRTERLELSQDNLTRA